MVGTSLTSPGGMTAVVETYRKMGLFDSYNIKYLSTYEQPNIPTQLKVYFIALTRLFFDLLTQRVSLLHVHSAAYGSFIRKSIVCALASLFKVPYIFHLHSGEFSDFYHKECSKWYKIWIRHTLRNAQYVIALTEQWRSILTEIEPDTKIKIVYNPVFVPQTLPVYEKTIPTILFLGRLRQTKGIYDLLDTLPALLSEIPDLRLVLGGDGEIDEVHAYARNLGVENAVITLGWVDGIKKEHVLAEASVLALPSYFEGLPICIIEAMAQGIPVVATNVGGIPDIISNGESGLLVPPGNIPELTKALRALLLDQNLSKKISEKAYSVAQQKFATQKITYELGKIYAHSLQ